jgi:hypothetical protein
MRAEYMHLAERAARRDCRASRRDGIAVIGIKGEEARPETTGVGVGRGGRKWGVPTRECLRGRVIADKRRSNENAKRSDNVSPRDGGVSASTRARSFIFGTAYRRARATEVTSSNSDRKLWRLSKPENGRAAAQILF